MNPLYPSGWGGFFYFHSQITYNKKEESDKKLIIEFNSLVINLMHELCNIILDGYKNKAFLKQSS